MVGVVIVALVVVVENCEVVFKTKLFNISSQYSEQAIVVASIQNVKLPPLLSITTRVLL